MAIVLEAHRRQVQAPLALDENLRVGVHQNVGDAWILQQRLNRSEAQQFVENIVDELILFGVIERLVLFQKELANHLADLPAELLRRHLVDDRQVDHVEKALMQTHLQLGELGGLLDLALAGPPFHLGRYDSGNAGIVCNRLDHLFRSILGNTQKHLTLPP